jgi:hypothetical protein
VVFYGDVEHEVSLVESGYRVTLAYNLYFVDGDISPPSPPLSINSSPLFHAFIRALQDPDDGGTLGFGLYYEYPGVGTRTLKGSDAVLYEVGRFAGLNPQFKYVYDSGGAFHETNRLCGRSIDGAVGAVSQSMRTRHIRSRR